MSIASVQEFLAAVSGDQALQEELATAMNAENDQEAVTVLAKSKGYDFTADELGQEIQSRQAEAQKLQAAGELSDNDLEAVAGGAILSPGLGGLGMSVLGMSVLGMPGLGMPISKVKW